MTAVAFHTLLLSLALACQGALAQQVRLQLDNTSVELTVYSPSVIRVRINKQKLGDASATTATATATTYYEDDGASFTYENGAYCQRAISDDGAARRIVIGPVRGSFKSKFDKLQLVLHGFVGAAAFDPVSHVSQVKMSSATIGNDSGQLVVSY